MTALILPTLYIVHTVRYISYIQYDSFCIQYVLLMTSYMQKKEWFKLRESLMLLSEQLMSLRI